MILVGLHVEILVEKESWREKELKAVRSECNRQVPQQHGEGDDFALERHHERREADDAGEDGDGRLDLAGGREALR